MQYRNVRSLFLYSSTLNDHAAAAQQNRHTTITTYRIYVISCFQHFYDFDSTLKMLFSIFARVSICIFCFFYPMLLSMCFRMHEIKVRGNKRGKCSLCASKMREREGGKQKFVHFRSISLERFNKCTIFHSQNARKTPLLFDSSTNL